MNRNGDTWVVFETDDSLRRKDMKNIKKVLVVGATGGTGIATIEELIGKGYSVTALARTPEKLAAYKTKIKIVKGDIFAKESLRQSIKGQDAVVVALGISENPVRVRFLGPKFTPMNVRSAGTENVIKIMKEEGVKKLIVQSSFGVGESRNKLRLLDKIFFEALLKPQILDTERQESLVKNSGLNWVLAQPVHLIDKNSEEEIFASAEGLTQKPSITRKSVAKFLSNAVETERFNYQSVALSAA